MIDNPALHEGASSARGGFEGDVGLLASGQSNFDLRYITAAIRSNLKLIVVIILGALAMGLTITLLQTPRYTAAATIQINDASGEVLGGEAEHAQAVSTTTDTDRFLQTQVDVLKSRGLALRVVQRLNLAGDPHFYESEGAETPGAAATLEKARNKAAGLLTRNLLVTLPKDSRIVTIKFESADPILSSKIANAYVQEFIESNLQRKFDSSAYARDFLSKQLDSAKQRLEASERALNDYTRQSGLIITRAPSGGDKSGGDSSNSVTTSSLLQLNMAANDATAKRITAEARWRAVETDGLMNSTEVITNPAVSAMMSRKAEIETALSEERSRHLDDYPTVAAKRAQLAVLNNQVKLAATAVRNAIHSDYLAAVAAENNLKQQVKALKGDTLSEQDRTVQYSLLSHETDTNRQVYDGLLERYKQLNAIAGVSLSNVSPIDAAVAPSVPSSPNMLQNMLIAALVGIGLAVVIVYIKDQFDDSIRVPEDLEHKLGLSMLGVIPKTSSDPRTMLDDPKSSISEAYNSLRSALLYSSHRGLPHVMMVTSAQAAEGKSTTTLALAISLSRMEKKVLIIDCDLRRPSVHRTIDYDNQRGVSTLLTSEDSLLDTVRETSIPNLYALTSGPIPASPTEMISSPRLEELLKQACVHFDVVLLDSPPVLGLADSPALATLADGVIFVVEANRNRRGSMKTALRRLRATRPIILGGVLSKFDAQKAGQEYYDYYGYNYYQYVSEEKAPPA